MNSRPTFDPIAAQNGVEHAPFTRAARRDDFRRAKYSTSIVPIPGTYDVRLLVQPTAVAAIRRAFTLARSGKDAWNSFKRTGRFDPRQGPRAVQGNLDVFKRRTGQSTTRVKVDVLLDASGSMRNSDTAATIPHPTMPGRTLAVSRAMAAGVFGATVAQAIGNVPTVDLDVWQHAAYAGRMNLKWRWHKGTPVGAFNESINGIGAPGNADGHAIFAITEKMRRELKRGQRGIILVVSDGLPSVPDEKVAEAIVLERQPNEADWQYANRKHEIAAKAALVDAIAHARKHGIEVLGVAIDGSDQSAFYGDGTVIFKNGEWTALGRELARHIGAALAAR